MFYKSIIRKIPKNLKITSNFQKELITSVITAIEIERKERERESARARHLVDRVAKSIRLELNRKFEKRKRKRRGKETEMGGSTCSSFLSFFLSYWKGLNKYKPRGREEEEKKKKKKKGKK